MKMNRLFTSFKLLLVFLTAVFMSYHSQIFIRHIEPNPVFAWTAAILTECFLIVLSLSRGFLKLLIIPLFLVSVFATSASYVAMNNEKLSQYFMNQRIVRELQNDIQSTVRAYDLGPKYFMKTIQRERQLRDTLRDVLKDNDSMILPKFVIFFVFVFMLQLVSICTALDLKKHLFSETSQEISQETSQGISQKISQKMAIETVETDKEIEITESDKMRIVDVLKQEKLHKTLDQISRETMVAKTTISKVLQYPRYPISDEVFLKLKNYVERG